LYKDKTSSDKTITLNMKRLFLFFTVCTLVLTMNAQEVKLTWSPEIELKRKESISDIIYADKTGLMYTTVERKGGMMGFYKPTTFKSVEKLSSNFSPVFSKEITAFDDDYAIQDFYYIKNHFLIFVNKHFKKEDQTKYYVANMDMNGNINGNAKEYFTANKDDFSETASFSYYYSPDSTHLLAVAERSVSFQGSGFGFKALKSYKSNMKKEMKFEIIDIDNTGKKLWNKTIQIENKEDRSVVIEQKAINAKGDIFFLIKEYKSDKPKETIKDESGKKVPGYTYYVLKISDKGQTTKKFNVDMGKLYINSADLKINKKNDNAIISGFYNDQDNEVLKGLFYFEIDNSNAVINKNSKDFPDDFIQEFKKHKETKKDKKNNDNDEDGLAKKFTVDEILPREDGGAYLTSEYFYRYVVTTTTYNGNSTRTVTTTYYNYFDILVVNITPEGKIDWFYRVPKRQTEVNIIRYSSYISTVYGNNLYLLFNDNAKNMDIDSDEKAKATTNFKKGSCAMIKIGTDKSTSNKELFKNDDLEKILVPKKSVKMADNSIILFTDKYRDNDPKLGKLEIEK